MRINDLHLLPRVEDGLTFLYADRCRVEQSDSAIVLLTERGSTAVPVALLSCLLLGPGACVTHAAVRSCADSGCSLVWCGDGAVRCYASGTGETNSSRNLLAQAEAWAERRMQVVRTMYLMRFPNENLEGLSLEQLRGREGVRVRTAYQSAAAREGVVWSGRKYSGEWDEASPINRALSSANACLYGVVHAAIVSIGMSPALGFVHTGKALSFVYDVADLYKCELTVPIAFRESRGALSDLDTRVRRACRESFFRGKLLGRIVPDVQRLFGLRESVVRSFELTTSGELWDPDGNVAGAVGYGG